MQQRPAFGIYLNKETSKVRRANSPSAIPSGADWAILTPEVNMTLLKIRELAREKGLVTDAGSVKWQ